MNIVTKGAGFVNVTFDGSTDFDLCDVLKTNSVALWAITQDAKSANDTLTVRDGSASAVRLYGPFVDTQAEGKIRYYRGQVCKPYVKGSEATAASKASFECDWV